MSKQSREAWRSRQDAATAPAPEADTPPVPELSTAAGSDEPAASDAASGAAPDLLAQLAELVKSGTLTREDIRSALEPKEAPAPPPPEPVDYHWPCFRCAVVPGNPAHCLACAKIERGNANLNHRVIGTIRGCPGGVPRDAWAAAIEALLRTKARSGRAPAAVLCALLDQHGLMLSQCMAAAFAVQRSEAEAAE